MGEWVPAGKLHIGDAIRRADGCYGIVQASAFVYQPQPMYNLTVAEAHTYFVGDGQWLVHNCNWLDSIKKEAGSKLPTSWGTGQPNRQKVGWRWLDPNNPSGNGVRIDQGDPGLSNPSQRVDHVVVRHEGKVIDINGNPIPAGMSISQAENAGIRVHIPYLIWKTWSTWYQP